MLDAINGGMEGLIGELKENSRILIFGGEELISLINSKLKGCSIIIVGKNPERNKKIKIYFFFYYYVPLRT